MRTVAIIQGEGPLRLYLRGAIADQVGRQKYISCGEIKSEIVKLLREKGFEKIIAAKKDEDCKKRFIAEYIDLIGAISKEQNTKKWWASDIAAKNRSTSRLLHLLQQFLTIVETVKKENFRHLLIINPSWVIIPSVRKFLNNADVNLICLGTPIKKWIELMFIHSRRVGGVLCRIPKIYWRACYARMKLKVKLKTVFLDSKPYYVIKTFIYNHSFKKDGHYHDVFFGCLPKFLRDKKNVLIYPCILGDYKKCVKNIKKCPDYIIIPLEFFLSLTDILSAAVKILFCRVRIKKDAFFFGCTVKEIVNNEFLRTFNSTQFYQFLHYWSTKSLLKAVSVKTFLLTYENNPWEKMCEVAIREKSVDISIIGYQHTVVPQASVNMFVSRHEADIVPLPEKILTVGEIPKGIIERYGSYKGGTIEASCGLRFEYLFNILLKERKRSGNILIALEGIFEVYEMVNYVVGELADNTRYNVLIRTHPVLPLKYFRHKLKYNIEHIPNFKVSYGTSLKEDIEWADMVIYWGSTVALEALSMGRPVVHFDNGSIVSYDPLFECNDLKWTVSREESLVAKIEEIHMLSDENFYIQRDSSQAYLKQYFYPITGESLEKFYK